MQKPSDSLQSDGAREERRRHRVRLLGTLGGICRKIERLQPAGAARLACRDVAEGLRKWLAREEKRAGGRHD